MASTAEISSSPEQVVSQFLDSIRAFQYDKAKDAVDKQKEQVKSSSPESAMWLTILSALGQFAVAEKSYSSFLYLSSKWFGRKDAKSLYDVVAAECRKIEEYSMKPQAKLSAVAHVCGQLLPYVQVKCQMIDFFENLHSAATKSSDKENLLTKIQLVLRGSNNKFYHPQLAPLKSVFITECEVIESLLQSDIAMSRWLYTESLLHLQMAHNNLSKLLAMATTLPQSHLIKRTFLGMKTLTPYLHTWLKQYKNAVYSKFTLYFYEVLSKYCPHGDMRPHLNRCSIDYYAKLTAFHKKTDAYLIALVLNSEGLLVSGPGYSYSSIPPQTLQGKEAFITIFGYPTNVLDCGELSRLPCLPSFYQTSLVMFMSTKERQLNLLEKPVDFYDDRNKELYLVSRIDPTISLVLIYRSKKSEKEKKGIISFVTEVSSSLRYTKVFSELRPS
ncbi:KICSTOR subunit 2-like isoform X2 [Watersipora subatra]